MIQNAKGFVKYFLKDFVQEKELYMISHFNITILLLKQK